MAVASEVTNVRYPGNGSTTTEYPVTFPVLDGSHIKAGLKVEGQPFEELPSWKFTVVPKGGGAYAVTTTDAIDPEDTLVLWRELPITQPVELPLAGRLPSPAIEQALDRHTMQIQQLEDRLSRCIFLDRSALPQGAFQVTPNTLLGLDGAGDWAVFDPTRVRELALLGGVDAGNPIATWATDGDRPSTPPDFVGQIGTQRDDKTLWVGNSTTGGDWSPVQADIGNFRTVRNETQFAQCIENGWSMRVVGSVTINGAYEVLLPITIEGAPGAKISFTGDYFLNPQASTYIKNIEIEGVDRLSQRCFPIGGSRYDGFFILDNVTIHRVGNAVCADGGPSSPLMPDILIRSCRIYDVGGDLYTGGSIGRDGAIVISWNLRTVVIKKCSIWNTYGNGIYIGANGLKRIPPDTQDNSSIVADESFVGRVWIERNKIWNYDRNGIETFGTDYATIVFNQIHGGTGSFNGPGSGIAISCAGKGSVVQGNYVKDFWGYGIEITKSNTVVVGNVVDTCANDRSNPLFGLSLGGLDLTQNLLIEGNIFINILNKVYSHAAINCSNCVNTTIKGNKFYAVSVACNVQNTSCEAITFRDNEHHFSNGTSTLGAPYQFTFGCTSGTKHVVVHNITRGIGAAPAAGFYKFAQGFGGYYDFTTGQHIHGSPGYLEFGAISANLCIS